MPALYNFATLSGNDRHREQLETWFSNLSARSQTKLLPKLRNPNGFLETYNEVAIAGLLMELGNTVEYDFEINGFTPDWRVTSKIGECCFVEVYTRKVSRYSSLEEILLDRIKNIELPYGICLSYKVPVRDPDITDEKHSKEIAGAIKRWLSSEPSIGAQRIFDFLIVEVIRINPKWKNVQPMGPTKAFFVDHSTVGDHIVEKASKYRFISEQKSLPLVIAIVPSFDSGISGDSLLDELYGVEKVVVSGSKVGETYRGDDGLYSKSPHLSGIIGLWSFRGGSIACDVFPNKRAKIELPSSIFGLLPEIQNSLFDQLEHVDT